MLKMGNTNHDKLFILPVFLVVLDNFDILVFIT